MNNRWNCVGFGLCAFDYLAVVEKYPKINYKTDAIDFSKQGGGPVATAMAALGRLGIKKLAFVGKIGDDEEGEFIKSALEQDGVDTSFLKVMPRVPSPQAFVWIEKNSGKRSVVLQRDKRLNFELEEIKPEPFNQTKYLLIDGRDTEAALEVSKIAKRTGSQIVMDAGSLRSRMEDFFRIVDYFICSKNFLSSYNKKKSIEQGLLKIYKFGCKWVVVTSGEKGSVGFDGLNFYHEPAFPVNVVDTTGAGDVFHGAFIYGLLKMWSLPQILCFSNAVAALKCRKLGGRAGIPKLNEVNNFLCSKSKVKYNY